MHRSFILCLFAGSLLAQPPLIYNRAILNAASFMPPRLPGGAIAQGAIFSIFGTRIGPTTPAQVTAFPLSTNLGGVSISVAQGSTTVNAIPLYVSASQINAIMPSNAPVGAVSMRVTFNNARSNPMTAIIAPSAFGIFTATGTGMGPGILQNFVSQTNQPINAPTIAATPGQVITLWGTGLGPVPNDTVAPTAGNLPIKTEVFVGGVPASILYNGRTPCCAGTDQIVFSVPTNAPQGCWVPVSVRTGGTTVSNFVSMAITQDGSSCLATFPNRPLTTAGKHGAFLSLRVATHEDVGTKAPIDVTGDYTTAIAYQIPPSLFPFHPVYSYPPSNTCTVYTVKGDILRGDTLPGADPPGAKPLNFGAAITLSGPGGLKALQNFLETSPLRYLGGAVTGNIYANTLFLQPGSYNVSALGGSDIGGFSVSANMPQPLSWTNRDQTTVVNRTQPLTVAWGDGPSNVAIIGFGVDLPTDSTTIFGCVAPLGASSFTVPPMILSNVPATRPNPLQSKSVIYMVDVSPSHSTDLNATGLDLGFAAFQFASGKTVIFR